MRGLVMEIKENMLVVLTPEGEYLRIKHPGSAAIGETVSFEKPVPARAIRIPRRLAAVAASLLIACSAGLGAYGYSQPFGVVSIDINPSVALTYNWFQQVISAEGLNPDGQQLLSQLGDLKQTPVPEAVDRIIEQAGQAGYLEPRLANVVFLSVSDRGSKGRTVALLNHLEKALGPLPKTTETVLLTGDSQTYESALKGHESPTKVLVDASLKGDETPAPNIRSGKSLKEVLKEQKAQRDKGSSPAVSDTPADTPDTSPSESDSKKPADTEKPEDKKHRNGEKEKPDISKPDKSKPGSLEPTSPNSGSDTVEPSEPTDPGKHPDNPDSEKKGNGKSENMKPDQTENKPNKSD